MSAASAVLTALTDGWRREVRARRQPATTAPCSPRHGKHCSPAHAASVAAYRDARIVYEERVDEESVGYVTDRAAVIARDVYNGVCMTFTRWLHSMRENREDYCYV